MDRERPNSPLDSLSHGRRLPSLDRRLALFKELLLGASSYGDPAESTGLLPVFGSPRAGIKYDWSHFLPIGIGDASWVQNFFLPTFWSLHRWLIFFLVLRSGVGRSNFLAITSPQPPNHTPHPPPTPKKPPHPHPQKHTTNPPHPQHPPPPTTPPRRQIFSLLLEVPR